MSVHLTRRRRLRPDGCTALKGSLVDWRVSMCMSYECAFTVAIALLLAAMLGCDTDDTLRADRAAQAKLIERNRIALGAIEGEWKSSCEVLEPWALHSTRAPTGVRGPILNLAVKEATLDEHF